MEHINLLTNGVWENHDEGGWEIFTLVMEALLTVNVLTSSKAVSTADTCQKSESHILSRLCQNKFPLFCVVEKV